MKILEMTGKTVDDAINSALLELGATRNDVEVTVLDVGSKGILGFGSKLAKVSVKLDSDPVKDAISFLQSLIEGIGVSVDFESSLKDRKLFINIKGDDIGILIGKHGQTLDALQYLVSLFINKGDRPFISIHLDCEKYRSRRRDTIESLAFNLAKKARSSGKPVVLEPMTSYERQIIHFSLQNNKFVSTHSEGEGTFRHVIISPKSP